MKDHEKNKPDQTLDEALALMAEEVPPMPADFHEKWTKAVREEAAKTETEPEKKNNSRVISINRWTRILSVAAVFVFLIGGTLIYRSSRPKTTTLLSAEKDNQEAVQIKGEPVAEAAGAFHAMKAAEEENVIAAEEPAAANNMAAMEADVVMEEAAEADAVMEEAAETDAVMEEAAEADRPMMSFSASGASKDDAAMMDAESEETADAAMPMGAAEMETTAKEAPAPDPTQNPEEAAESGSTKAETENKEPGFLQSVGGFFGDMGAFLLTVWPYLLILAVPAAAALLYRKKKRQH